MVLDACSVTVVQAVQASLLSDVDRRVGVGIAVVGAVAVVPEGSKLLLVSTWRWLRHRAQGARAQLARLFPFLGKNVNIQAKGLSTSKSATASVVAAVTDAPWLPDTSLAERIDILRQRIKNVEDCLTALSADIQREISDRRQALVNLEASLRAELNALESRMRQAEREAASIDARGLPVIAAGILLSGIPDGLASIPYGLGWAFPVVGIIFAMVAAGPTARRLAAWAWAQRPRTTS